MTAITAEQLLEIIDRCGTTITLPDLSGSPEWMSSGGESFEVIDKRSLVRELEEFIAVQPQTVFADLIGMTRDEAMEVLNARAPYLKKQHPVEKIVGLVQVGTDGGATFPLSPGDLLVRATFRDSDGEHIIAEILRLA